jgi:hypothetical protein
MPDSTGRSRNSGVPEFEELKKIKEFKEFGTGGDGLSSPVRPSRFKESWRPPEGAAFD